MKKLFFDNKTGDDNHKSMCGGDAPIKQNEKVQPPVEKPSINWYFKHLKPIF